MTRVRALMHSKSRTDVAVCAAFLVYAAAAPSPFRFNRGQHVCAVEGGPCTCDGVVTFHSIQPTTSGAVRMRLDDGLPPNSSSLAPRTVACSRSLTFAPETLNAGPRPGVCVCHRRDTTRPAAPGGMIPSADRARDARGRPQRVRRAAPTAPRWRSRRRQPHTPRRLVRTSAHCLRHSSAATRPARRC